MNHAVLYQQSNGNYTILTDQGKKLPMADMPALFERFLMGMEKLELQCMWVMPDTYFAQNVNRACFDEVDHDRWKVFPPSNDKTRKTPPGFLAFTRKNTGHYEKDRYISFPGYADWGDNGKPWHMPDADTLITTVDYLGREYHEDIIWSSQNLGMRVLKRTHRKRGWEIDNLQDSEELWKTVNSLMPRPSWRRPITNQELIDCLYLHGYDKNGQFLGGSQSVVLGGNAHYEFVHADRYDEKAIGFWQYRIVDVSNTKFNGRDIYCPLDVNRHWASTDLIQAARSVGVDVAVSRGVIWPYGEKYLAPWAKEMWEHRANLRDEVNNYTDEIARQNAVDTSKQAANSLMGRLAMPQLKSGIQEYHRPDWNELVVQRAIANQVYSINKIQRDHGITPVLVVTDSFYIVSPDPNPATAIPGILDHSQEQRGYKHLGTLRLNSDIINSFQLLRPDALSSWIKQEMEN